MTDDLSKSDERALDRLFAEAGKDAPAPSADFMARLAADADAAAPEFSWAVSETAQDEPWLSRIGRWMTATGLAGSAALGVWIGFVSPDLLNDVVTFSGTDSELALSDFLTGADLGNWDEIGADG